MKDFNELIERSYTAIRARGLISNKTTIKDFRDKFKEEYEEMEEARILDNEVSYIEESIDLITVKIMELKHILNIDFVREFEKCIIKNEERAKQ